MANWQIIEDAKVFAWATVMGIICAAVCAVWIGCIIIILPIAMVYNIFQWRKK